MARPNNSRQAFIQKGYEHFALYGPTDLSINAISKEIGSSRASFYHHFGDLEVFINILLKAHLDTADRFTAEGKERCNHLFPDFYDLLEKYPMGVKFQRQLFLNRHETAYDAVFNEIIDSTCDAFILDLFIRQYQLSIRRDDARNLWYTLTDSWYSRIEPDNLGAREIQQIAIDILDSILKFIPSEHFTKLRSS